MNNLSIHCVKRIILADARKEKLESGKEFYVRIMRIETDKEVFDISLFSDTSVLAFERLE